MIITCPKCEIQYSVEPDGFGSSGRKVRCFSCAYQWFQHPVTVNVPRAAPPAPAPAPQHYATPGQMPPYPPPGYVLVPEGYPPPASAGQAAMAGVGFPDTTLQEAAEADEIADINSMFEPIETSTDDHVVADKVVEDPVTEMSQDDLDAMFESEDDPVSVKSIVDEIRDEDRDDSASTNDDNDSTDIDETPEPESGSEPEPEPEPLPAGLTGDMPDDDLDLDMDDDDEIPVRRRKSPKNKPSGKKKKSRGGLAFMSVLIVLAGLGSSVVLLRDMVIQMVPAVAPVYEIIDPALESAHKMIDPALASVHEMIGPVLEPVYEMIDPLLAPVYEMLGLASSLGEGLEIGNVASERTSEGGVDALVVSGNISNVSGDERAVPLIKAMLMDSDGVEIQSVVQEPDMDMIADGEALNFTIMMKDPSPLARRLEVTFAPRPNSDPGESMQQ